MTAPCKQHGDRLAVVSCGSCSTALCDACFRFRVDGAPWCARCANEADGRPGRRVSLSVAFVTLSWGGLWLMVRRSPSSEDHFWAFVTALVALGIGLAIGYSAFTGRRPDVREREPSEVEFDAVDEVAGSHPYRARARRVVQSLSPRVSGRAVTAVVGASLLFCAVALPVTLHLPHWVELELVLGLWWAALCVALTVLLFRDYRLKDDYAFHAPWEGAGAQGGSSPSTTRSDSKWADGCGNVGGCSADGVGELAVIALLLALALGAAWLLVELALPALFLLVYSLLMKALGSVANDRHECEGRFWRALGWGAAWAFAYVAPLAVVAFVLRRALH